MPFLFRKEARKEGVNDKDLSLSLKYSGPEWDFPKILALDFFVPGADRLRGSLSILFGDIRSSTLDAMFLSVSISTSILCDPWLNKRPRSEEGILEADITCRRCVFPLRLGSRGPTTELECSSSLQNNAVVGDAVFAPGAARGSEEEELAAEVLESIDIRSDAVVVVVAAPGIGIIDEEGGVCIDDLGRAGTEGGFSLGFGRSCEGLFRGAGACPGCVKF